MDSGLKIIIGIFATMIVLFILFFAMIVLNTTHSVISRNSSYTNVKVMNVETNTGKSFSSKFGFWNGEKTKTIHAPAGSQILIKYNLSEIEEGSLKASISDNNGVLLNINSGENDSYIYTSKEDTNLIIIINAQNCKEGGYKFEWEYE